MILRFAFALLAASVCAHTTPQPDWTLARSSHFEVYSQSGAAPARAALGWFEQLRAFFVSQTNLDWAARPPVRVIGFRSAAEFREYTSRTAADAYYLGTPARDTIVMSGLAADQFRVAAHEYAHVLLQGDRGGIPSWLSEGFADFLSTVHISRNGSTIGGDLPGRSRLLAGERWMPLADLFRTTPESPLRENRKSAELFYAESWALVHMLVLSPRYNSRFTALIAALNSGTPAAEAFPAIYERRLDAIESDAHAWIAEHKSASMALPGISMPAVEIQISDVPALASGLLLAELLTDSGELEHAETLYRDLERRAPGTAAISAGLGAVALRRGDRADARAQWQRAIARGITDPTLCYRYAMLAQEASAEADEIRPALERAIALQADFDDARYALALLEMNAGRFEPAVAQFQAIKTIPPERAYSYWSGFAYSLNELERREEAKAAAHEAARNARTAEERAHAAELAYFADTDLAVRFTRDGNGRPQLVTARAPHGQTDWNPFIEPSDRIRRVEATLSEILCDGTTTRIVVITGRDRLRLGIPDPSRVQMRHAPPEFTCGPQAPRAISVEYALGESKDLDGIVRGIEFR